jgi:hypothetical membrane protein
MRNILWHAYQNSVNHEMFRWIPTPALAGGARESTGMVPDSPAPAVRGRCGNPAQQICDLPKLDNGFYKYGNGEKFMKTTVKPMTEISLPAVRSILAPARLAVAASVAALLFLASLHILSPEFDPSWRMVSEYANGQYAWVLSLMFLAWGISSWALAFAIWSQVRTRAGKIGLVFLIVAGIGEAMASVFDINHPLHGLAGLIGIGGLPVAALLISVSLSRIEGWLPARKALLWTANLTWISVLLLAATFVILIVTYTQAGGDMTAQVAPAVLPPSVIALVGWANRFLIVAFCAWVMTVAWQALKLREQEA